MDLELRRRFFAEEIEAVARLRSERLVNALAAVPRERFLRPGPWPVVSDTDVGATMGMAPVRTRLTPDADPARVYHNISVGIDEHRQLFNGQPSTVAAWIDQLELTDGARVLHIGAGLGYYTAILGQCAGPGGRVLAFEADDTMAASARQNLAAMSWIEVRASTDADPAREAFDAILVNAGMTHPLPAWLDALTIGGRMILPLTATMPVMKHVGKGLVLLISRDGDATFSARVTGFVVIYSAVGLREERLNEQLGRAMAGGPQKWMAIARLRRDPHEPGPSCWLHDTAFCLSA